MVLSEQAVRRWKVLGGITTLFTGFITVFVVDYARPPELHDIRKKNEIYSKKHVFTDLQDWFWGGVDARLGIPRPGLRSKKHPEKSENYKREEKR
mmetsp:Transcript_24062/g.37109  ORF Transcript_24062/g.37109 Transcript_24062/m.37109 type:complete len:95 (+) Transcript_24062:139-423(+)|eukprot:CAMPEP_0196816142 /NCGR_PEP_ID=MMETSP1362-20130617/53687_1 /TAXON_ID=163516 /ORGANISM="Leptocylindrus danicus, Strain CCMP1856" /LENGTH=94 /DNA_ID=CAMNT_0042193359 /DNA_START=35 /DNA_END=319 /DNA_ORIENTATION=+